MKKLSWAVLPAVLFITGCANYEPSTLPMDQPYPSGPGLLTGDEGVYQVDFKRTK